MEREPEPEQESVGPDTDPDMHQDPDEPVGVSDEALDTEELGEGGPSGA